MVRQDLLTLSNISSRHQIKDIVTLRANRLQLASHSVPSEDAGSWAERSRVQPSADNDPCPAAPSYDHRLSTSPMELQQRSGSVVPPEERFTTEAPLTQVRFCSVLEIVRLIYLHVCLTGRCSIYSRFDKSVYSKARSRNLLRTTPCQGTRLAFVDTWSQ